MPKRFSRVINVIAQHGQLTPEDRKHLMEHRLLKPEIHEDNFLSGDVVSLTPAIEELKRQGLMDEAEREGLLVWNNGNLNWNEALVSGGVLIVYRNQEGQPFHIRAHKKQMKGVPLELYGLDCLGEQPKRVVLTEGEYKARLLNQEEIPAVGMPGVASHAGKHYESLFQTMRDAGVEKCVILYDNDDRVSPLLSDGRPNPKYNVDPARRYDVPFYSIRLARQLTYDGIKTGIAHLPDEWRTNGQADVDSVCRDGHTAAELLEIIDAAVEYPQYLQSVSEEGRSVILGRLGDGTVKRCGDEWLARSYPMELVFTPRMGRVRGRLVLRVGAQEVFRDTVNVDSAKSRNQWVREAAEQAGSAGPQEKVEELLALLVSARSKEGPGGGAPSDSTMSEINVLSSLVQKRLDGYYLTVEGGYKQFSNCTAEVLVEEIRDDGLRRERHLRGVVLAGGAQCPFELRAKDFVSQGLLEHLTEQAGSALITDDSGLFRRTVQADSTPTTTVILEQFGWHNEGRFLTPTGQICPEGVDPIPELKIDLSRCGNARHLDLIELPEAELLEVTRYIFTDLLQIGDSLATPFLLGFAFSPIVGEYAVPELQYGLHLQGLSGALKTTYARALACFFGPGFGGPGALLTWTTTPNALQKSGYYYSSAVVVIDDFKTAYAQREAGKQMLIQNYGDRQARGRLQSNSTFMKSYEFRGHILSTGEDSIDSSASNTARLLPVEWSAAAAMATPAEKVSELSGVQGKFSAFTRALVQHVQKEGRDKLRKIFEGNKKAIGELVSGTANGPRLATFMALNLASFQAGLMCAAGLGAITELEMYQLLEKYKISQEHIAKSICARLQGGEPAETFLHYLRAATAAQPSLVCAPNSGSTYGDQIIHLRDDEDGGYKVIVVPDAAFNVVVTFCHKGGRPFPFSFDAVRRDLASKGHLIREDDKHLTVQIRIGKARSRCWRFKPGALGFEAATVEELFSELKLVKPDTCG